MSLDLVVMQDPLCKGLVQHFPVPLLQPLRLGDLLVGRMAVEDIVVPFTGRTRPDVALGISADTHIYQKSHHSYGVQLNPITNALPRVVIVGLPEFLDIF